jgi:hypothetical protein
LVRAAADLADTAALHYQAGGLTIPIANQHHGTGATITCNLRLFPLTPALSLGERENPRQTHRNTMIPVGGWPEWE